MASRFGSQSFLTRHNFVPVSAFRLRAAATPFSWLCPQDPDRGLRTPGRESRILSD